MTVDLAVATPTYLDLTLVGLESLPVLGEERFAADLLRSPGGGAITAVGAARLGVSTALVAPLGDDLAGDLIREALSAEGVQVGNRKAPRTPVTIVLPVGDDRAMATVDPGVRASAADVAALRPRAVATNLDILYCAPPDTWCYVTCGEDEARAFVRRPPEQLSGVRALFVNEREARILTGSSNAEAAGAELAKNAAAVIVTRGRNGATAVVDGERYETSAFEVGPAVDTTGAGDLLAAAYVWADLRGAPPEDRLRWSVLYAGLSVTTPTAVAGAATLQQLLDAGKRHGLTLPEVG
jgi:ribokinase